MKMIRHVVVSFKLMKGLDAQRPVQDENDLKLNLNFVFVQACNRFQRLPGFASDISCWTSHCAMYPWGASFYDSQLHTTPGVCFMLQ